MSSLGPQSHGPKVPTGAGTDINTLVVVQRLHGTDPETQGYRFCSPNSPRVRDVTEINTVSYLEADKFRKESSRPEHLIRTVRKLYVEHTLSFVWVVDQTTT